MEGSGCEKQCAEASEERFAQISEGELNSLLESRHSKATKNSTQWAISTFKGTYIKTTIKTDSVFKYFTYKITFRLH